jgi:hypothetical protein
LGGFDEPQLNSAPATTTPAANARQRFKIRFTDRLLKGWDGWDNGFGNEAIAYASPYVAKPKSADYGRKVAAVADNVGEHRYRDVVRNPWRDGEFRVAMAGPLAGSGNELA